MNLIKQYKEYVKWCDLSSSCPIGFVNWKAKRFGYTWDRKKHIYVYNK